MVGILFGSSQEHALAKSQEFTGLFTMVRVGIATTAMFFVIGSTLDLLDRHKCSEEICPNEGNSNETLLGALKEMFADHSSETPDLSINCERCCAGSSDLLQNYNLTSTVTLFWLNLFGYTTGSPLSCNSTCLQYSPTEVWGNSVNITEDNFGQLAQATGCLLESINKKACDVSIAIPFAQNASELFEISIQNQTVSMIKKKISVDKWYRECSGS